jgi:DNA topoisomerase-1
MVGDLSPCTDFVRGPDGKWTLHGELVEGDSLKRLTKMGIPPAWTNVVVSVDPASKIQCLGIDKAGRWQYRYSAEHVAEAARNKFNRLKLFAKDIPTIRVGIEDGITSHDDPRAWLLRLEDKTAIRVGSTTDFKAKQKAYGLTTLQKEHLKIDGDKIFLDFIAKEGKQAHYELEDRPLANWLQSRWDKVSDGERLFPDVSANKLNDYLKALAGGRNYSIKDFRTFHGTRIAFDILKEYAGLVLSDAEKKKLIKSVSETVSGFLHNSPAMAKASYIDPMVWDFIGGL